MFPPAISIHLGLLYRAGWMTPLSILLDHPGHLIRWTHLPQSLITAVLSNTWKFSVPMEQLPGLPEAAFDKADPSPDAEFYADPRFVTHIDDAAIAAVTQ